MVRLAAEPVQDHPEYDAGERPLPLSKAPKLFASNPSIGTLWRWMQDGITAPNGERVRLRFTLIGRRRFIEPIAAREFLAACNAAPATQQAAPKGAATAALVALGY